MLISNLTTIALAASTYQSSTPAIPWARIVLAFLVCIAFAVGAILWLRARQGLPSDAKTLLGQLRLAPPASPQALAVEHRLRTTATGQIVILRCGERRYLIHLCPQGAQMIDRLDDLPAEEEPAP